MFRVLCKPFQVREHLLAKAEKDREGGVADSPVEDDEFSGPGSLEAMPVSSEEEVAPTMMEA